MPPARAVKLRRVRGAQKAVLGGHDRRDLVALAERLETGFVELRDWVDESLRGLDERSITRFWTRVAPAW